MHICDFVKKEKAFTLIELLIVIAIIGILAGVILVSTGSARNKAKDANIMQAARSFMSAAQVDGITTGDYSSWFPPASTGFNIDSDAECNDYTQSVARATCKQMIGYIGNADPRHLWIGSWAPPLPPGSPPTNKWISIVVFLPGDKKFYCIGSNGKNSKESLSNGSGCTFPGLNSWRCPGCPGQIVDEIGY